MTSGAQCGFGAPIPAAVRKCWSPGSDRNETTGGCPRRRCATSPTTSTGTTTAPRVCGPVVLVPLKSEAQRRWMHAKHPQMAQRWEAETPTGKRLPAKLGKKRKSNKRSRDDD